jgi:hypothetical protein
MNLTEDQLRSALHETGEEVSPTRVPPLRLPADTAGWRVRLPGVPARRWLPAAAAVTAVAAVAAVLGVLAGGARPARPAGAGPLAQLPPIPWRCGACRVRPPTRSATKPWCAPR